MASIRSLGGGEIHEYTSLLEDTRRQALDRLVQNATLVGANAVALDALRQLRAVGHDERDRRLRHGRRRHPGRVRGAPPAVRVAGDDRRACSIGRALVVLGGILLAALGLVLFVSTDPPLITGVAPGRDRRRDDRRRAHRADALPLRRGGVRRRATRARVAANRSTSRWTRGSSGPTSGSSIRRPDRDARLDRSDERRAAVPRRGVTLVARSGSPGAFTGPCYPRRPGPIPTRLRVQEPIHPPMAAVDPGAPARPVAPARPRRPPRTKSPLPYLNRELSWLEFNARVLHEARDERNPLLERVKFLTIFASNLDEFFQVRIAGLREQVESGSVPPRARRPHGRRQLAAARERVLELVADHSADLRSTSGGPSPRKGVEVLDYSVDPRASRGAPAALPRRDLPGPDAARGRPGPPVPVHLDAQPVDRGRAHRPRDRRARASRGSRCPQILPRLLEVGADALRAHRPGHRGQPRRAVPRHGDRRAPPLPGHPQRRPRDRGGRGRRPAARDRGGAAPAALRRGGPPRGRALDAGRDAHAPAARPRPRRRRTATRSAACST